jgi:hypothetical protein
MTRMMVPLVGRDATPARPSGIVWETGINREAKSPQIHTDPALSSVSICAHLWLKLCEP